MKSLWAIAAAAAVVIGLCAPAKPEDIGGDEAIAKAVAATTTRVVEESGVPELAPQQVELARALRAVSEGGSRTARIHHRACCFYNCPPPVGSVTAVPSTVSVPANEFGSVTMHWRWDQSPTQAIAQHGCLWVSGSEESEAHLVQCEVAGHTYATTVGWIGVGRYVFRVAPGHPDGPYTKPVEGLFQLAQAIVVGVGPDRR